MSSQPSTVHFGLPQGNGAEDAVSTVMDNKLTSEPEGEMDTDSDVTMTEGSAENDRDTIHGVTDVCLPMIRR